MNSPCFIIPTPNDDNDEDLSGNGSEFDVDCPPHATELDIADPTSDPTSSLDVPDWLQYNDLQLHAWNADVLVAVDVLVVAVPGSL